MLSAVQSADGTGSGLKAVAWSCMRVYGRVSACMLVYIRDGALRVCMGVRMCLQWYPVVHVPAEVVLCAVQDYGDHS